jgi:hypothetical protein
MDASDTTRNKKAKSFYLFIFSNKSQYKTLISNYENRLLYTLGYNIINSTNCVVAPPPP